MAVKGRRRKKRRGRTWLAGVLLALLCAGVWWWSATPSRGPQDPAAAGQDGLRELRQRAEQGDETAQLELAESYCRGTGVRKNIFQCAEWYRKAANLGSGAAMLRLGDLYAAGEGFILDREAAAMWWRKAEVTEDGAAGAKSRLRKLTAGSVTSRRPQE